MAQVTGKVTGGSLQLKTAVTAMDLGEQLGVPNHQAFIQGEPVNADYELQEGDFVTFNEKTKGA